MRIIYGVKGGENFDFSKFIYACRFEKVIYKLEKIEKEKFLWICINRPDYAINSDVGNPPSVIPGFTTIERALECIVMKKRRDKGFIYPHKVFEFSFYEFEIWLSGQLLNVIGSSESEI